MRSGTLTTALNLQTRTPGLLFTFRAALLCVLGLCCWSRAEAQVVADALKLRVQILDGKTGRPVENQHLLLQREDGHPIGSDGASKAVTTDGEGYAAVPNVDPSIPAVFILVESHRPCSKAQRHDFSLLTVRTLGVVSENSCRPRITLFPQAGTLIFFVRPETFFERMWR